MMLEKRSRPFHKLLEPVTSDNRTGFSGENPALSWTSPLDLKMRSPRRWKNQESEGIGLGIVAALEKSSTSKIKMVGISNASVTNPIPIATPRTTAKNCCSEEFGLDNFESYTCVISQGPNSNFTSDDYHVGDKNRGDSDTRWGNWGHEIQAYPMADFLKCCSLCLKKLHGNDIFMYRGEKAFCSPECRYQQIMADEHKEMYGSEVSKTSKISASPYSGNRLFFTGILVA